MAWIESHETLPSHPKTKRMCRNLKITPVVAVGHLHYLWWWAMNHAQDGKLDKYTADDIADACGWEGDSEDFLNSLVSSGFVDRTQEGHSIHDWYDYAGKLIALRQKDAERKRKSREKTETSDGHPEDIQGTTDGSQEESIRNPNLNPNHKKPSRPKSKKTIYDEQSIPFRLANYLLKSIREFKPDIKEPNLQVWSDDMRKLVELDKRDPKQIGEVIEWVTKDDFWQANILCASTLRDKWDKVTAKMQQGNRGKHTEKRTATVEYIPTEEERKRVADAARKQGLPATYNDRGNYRDIS